MAWKREHSFDNCINAAPPKIKILGCITFISLFEEYEDQCANLYTAHPQSWILVDDVRIIFFHLVHKLKMLLLFFQRGAILEIKKLPPLALRNANSIFDSGIFAALIKKLSLLIMSLHFETFLTLRKGKHLRPGHVYSKLEIRSS